MDSEHLFSIRFHENDQEVALAGALRPAGPEEFAAVRAHLDHAADAVRGVLFLNFKRLRYLNHTGFIELARFVADCRRRHPSLRLRLIISSVVPWAAARFACLGAQFDNLVVEQYDRAFYPGQGVIENDQLVPVLRTQTSIIWPQERELLRRHGLQPRMRVADICCGIGDFAVLVYKEFAPEAIVGVDHSQPFLQYAQQMAREFGIADIEYQYGDAANLFLPTSSFDFVTSRLALQIFNDPAGIVRELMRICKPGGRVYLTNEMTAHNYGHPRHDSIAWTYQHAVEIAHALGMDMNFGPKMFTLLTDMGFEDVRIEHMPITNLNTPPDEFARAIESWEEYVTGELSAATQQPPEAIERLRMGFRDHVFAIKSRRGYAAWSIYVASGRKPGGR